MKRNTKWIWVIAFLSQPLFGWTLVAPNLIGWQTRKLTISINYSNCTVPNSTLDSLIDQAISTWNGVPTADITLVRNPTPSTTTVASFLAGTATDSPLILCDPTFAADNNGADPNQVPAATWPGSTYPLRYGGMILNAQVGTAAEISQLYATNRNLLVITLAHETGHILGLGHSGIQQALMYYSIAGKTQAVVVNDDRDGLSYIYPRNEFRFGTFGCGAVHEPNASSTNGLTYGAALLFALLVNLFLGRRYLSRIKSERLLLTAEPLLSSGFRHPSSKS